MKKKDFLIIAVVLLLAGILALVFHFAGGAPSNAVQVKVDGKVVGTYSLAESRTIPIETENGHNTLVIEGGKAHMADADCPDKYCMDQGEISKTGETIVCLPHKVVVEAVSLDGTSDNDIDVLVK